jgi:XRE family transcriptional regulator, regulator of sulfur utilization
VSAPASAVGARIREVRSARGWSLSELARRSGLGKGTLSELEAGTRNATLDTLYAVSGPLGVGLADLLAPVRTAAPLVVPGDDGDPVRAVLLDVLPASGGGAVEVYRLTVHPGGTRRSPAHGPAVRERLTLASGAAEVGPVGAEQRIGPGETAEWTSDGPHTFTALGPEEAVGVLVIHNPGRQSNA